MRHVWSSRRNSTSAAPTGSQFHAVDPVIAVRRRDGRPGGDLAHVVVVDPPCDHQQMPFGHIFAVAVPSWGAACALTRRPALGSIAVIPALLVNELPFLVAYLLIADTVLAWSEGDLATPGGATAAGVALLPWVAWGSSSGERPESMPPWEIPVRLGGLGRAFCVHHQEPLDWPGGAASTSRLTPVTGGFACGVGLVGIDSAPLAECAVGGGRSTGNAEPSR
jgi:hypothetical protein